MSKMNEAVKELKVLTVSKCTEDGAAYMAVLKEKDGERILPVLIERSEAFLLLMKMKGNKRILCPLPWPTLCGQLSRNAIWT